MKKTTKLTIETERLLIIRGGSSHQCARCEACGEVVSMVTVDEGAMLAQVGSRTIYRLVEAGKIHFIETRNELLLICFNSLCRGLSQAETWIIDGSTNPKRQGHES
jgi:hypothetical protein